MAAPLIIAGKDKVIKLHTKWVNVIDDWCGSGLKVLNYCAQDRLIYETRRRQTPTGADDDDDDDEK